MKSIWIATLLFAATACAAKDNARGDTALSHDLALAGQVQQQQPTFHDTAISPAPVPTPQARQHVAAPTRRPDVASAAQPAPVAPAPEPAASTVAAPDTTPAQQPARAPSMVLTPLVMPAPSKQIPVGTSIPITAASRACISTSRPGDKLVATVDNLVAGLDGGVIPAGSSVVLEVASVTPASATDSAEIAFRVRSIVVNGTTYPVSGDVAALAPLEKVSLTKTSDDRNKVLGGAVAGAIIGQILGKNTKGTVIGAATGAAAGAVAAKASQKYDGCVPQGAPLRVTLRQAIPM